MPWPPALLLTHPQLPWCVDAESMGISAEALDGLQWARAFSEMEALEAGAIANGDEQRQVGHYWLRAPERAPTMGQAEQVGQTVEEVQAFASKVRSGGITAENGQPFTDVLHVGIGGSALGPQLLIDALDGEGLGLHFLDNTDPDGVARVLAGLGDRLKTTLVVVVTKSGGTSETLNGLRLASEALRAAGVRPARHLVAVTCEGSKLDALHEREGWLARFLLWDWVGGRFSVTSSVGLLPAALRGLDVAGFLAGARDMDDWTRTSDWRTNPAALMAGCWYLAGQGHGNRDLVVLPYSDRLLLMSRYLQQLLMESLGKRLDRAGNVVEQGLTVYGNKGSTDQHAFVQQLRDGRADFFVTFIQVLGDGAGSATPMADGANAGDFLQGFLLGTRRALAEGGRPSLTITVPRVDASVLGGLIAVFERAVGLYASLIDVNAYHQPGVEAGKKASKAVLSLSASLQEALSETPKTAAALAEPLGADPLEVLYVLERLRQTGRATREGDWPTGGYRRRRGKDVD